MDLEVESAHEYRQRHLIHPLKSLLAAFLR